MANIFDLKLYDTENDSGHIINLFMWDGNYTSNFNSEARFVFDLGNSGNSKWGTNTGQSGYIISSHYSDQYSKFVSGNLLNIYSSYVYISRLVNKDYKK